MNALAGLTSIAGALYLAARHHGLGKPVESQPQEEPASRFSEAAEVHETRAFLFLKTAQSAVGRASVAVALGDCRKGQVLLMAAQAAISQLKAHALSLPKGEQRRSLSLARKDIESEFLRVSILHRERCVVPSVRQ
jgi:hypothetical protein